MPKTIAIDARIINSGTGRYVERLVHYLEMLDKTNTYYILVPKKDLNYYQPSSPNFLIKEADFANYSLAEQTGFLHFLNDLKPDLVHFCMPQQPVRYKGLHVTTVHDLTLLQTYNSDKNYVVFKLKQLVGRYVFKKIARTSAHIFTPTRYVKDAFAAFARIPAQKITVTYEGSSVSAVTPQPYQPLVAAPFIMYAGTQSDYKNIRRLILAHQALRKNHPDLILALVGRLSTQHKANKKWVEKQGYQGVLFTDFLSDQHLRWCMEHTLAYVFPSLMEGFGLPAVEAGSAGAPLVLSNASCLPEVHGDAAVYFDPLDVSDMAATIERVITNPKLQRELSQKAKAHAAQYSWHRMTEQTYNIYQTVLTQQITE